MSLTSYETSESHQLWDSPWLAVSQVIQPVSLIIQSRSI